MGINQNSDQSVQSVSVQSSEGVSMNTIEFKIALQQHYANFVQLTGKGGYTDFRKHVEASMKAAVKPMCGRSAMSPSGDGTWRDQVKAQFKGRGRQWIWVAKETVQPTIDRLSGEGFDSVDYERWIANQDNAWVRFAGPRVVDGVPMGAFELRLDGSKVDCPKMLHYIPVDKLDEDGLNRMSGTPHSLGLEVDAPVAQEEVVEEVAMTPVVETEIPDQVAMTGLNEFFEAEPEEEYVDVMDVMDDCEDIDDDLFGEF